MTSLIIIDFDGVLLNDQKFKKDYMRLFKDFGVSTHFYERAYQELKNKTGFYDPRAHIAILKKNKTDLNNGGLTKKINSFVKNTYRYIYKDAFLFLKFLRKRKRDMVLLSTGPDFQNLKIKNSRVADYFKKIIVIPRADKSEAVFRVIKRNPRENPIFIDDKKEVVDGVKKELPNVYVIQLARRKDQARSKIADKVLSNLSEVRILLSDIYKLSI